MIRSLLVVVACVSCKGKTTGEPAKSVEGSAGSGSGSGGMVEPVFRGGEQTDREGIPELRFDIDRVYEQQQAAVASPWHAAGGNWTYFDAHVAGDPRATFTVGVQPATVGREGPSFGKAVLVPTTAEAGGRVVQAFAATFRVPAPPPAKGQLAPLRVEVAVLGHGIADMGNAYGGNGSWDATKWFLSSDDIDSAEIFFNYSTADKRGVWSQKDGDYNKDIARVLAIALRDGQPLPRTAATDPTLAAKPAQLVIGARIAGKRAEVIGSSGDHALVEVDEGDQGALLAVDLTTGVVKQLHRTTGALELGTCTPTLSRCVIHELARRSATSTAAAIPSSLLLVDGAKVTPLAIPTTADGSLSISDDGKVLVTSDAAVLAWDVATGKKLATLTDPDASKKDSSSAVGWRGGSVIVAFGPIAGDVKLTYSLWHLDTGKREPIADPDDIHRPFAPDHSRRIDFTDGKATVTPLPSGAPRTLALDSHDYAALAGGATQWLDSRYVAIPGKHGWGFFDTDAMKVSLLPDAPDDERHLDILVGSGHVLARTADGTFLAAVKP